MAPDCSTFSNNVSQNCIKSYRIILIPDLAASVPDLVKLSQVFELREFCPRISWKESSPRNWKYLRMRKRNGYRVTGKFSHFRNFSTWREKVWIMHEDGIRDFSAATVRLLTPLQEYWLFHFIEMYGDRIAYQMAPCTAFGDWTPDD